MSALSSHTLLLHLLLASTLLPTPPAPAEPPAFTPPSQWLRGVWSDGDGLLAVLEHNAVHLSCRTGEQVSLTRFWRLRAVHGAWIDDALVVAAVSEDGQLARWQAGAWKIRRVPRIADDTLLGVGVDARGGVVVAGKTGGAYRLRGEAWQILPYPTELPLAVSLTLRDDCSFIVLGARGELALGEADAEDLRRILVLDLPKEPAIAWQGAALWIAGADELVRVDTEIWRVTRRSEHRLFGRVRVLTGLAGPDGDRVVLGAQRSLAVHDGKQLRPLPFEVVFPEGLALDLRSASLQVASRDGLVVRPLAALEPARARLPAEARPCPLPPGHQRQTLDDLTRPVPKASPPPAATQPPEPEAATPRPGRKHERPRPTLRLGFGGAYAPRSTPVAGASRSTGGFTLDLALGAVVPLRKHVFLWPELGYSYSVRERHAGHFFTAGLAPMFGTRLAQVGLAPRLVTGDAWGVTGVGLRSGLVGSFGLNILSVELGHQWLRAGGRDLHDGRFMISVDLVTVAAAVMVVALARAIFR